MMHSQQNKTNVSGLSNAYSNRDGKRTMMTSLSSRRKQEDGILPDGQLNRSIVRRTVMGFPKQFDIPNVHSVSSHRGTTDASQNLCRNFSNGKYKAFGDDKNKLKGTYYKSFDPSKGGSLGGGTWWDDSRDQPLFNDEMPVF